MSTAAHSPFAAGLSVLSVAGVALAAVALLAGLVGGLSPADPSVTIPVEYLVVLFASVAGATIFGLFACVLFLAH